MAISPSPAFALVEVATIRIPCTGLLFDWLHPAHFPTIIAALEAWADVPEVANAILKFTAEFVLNKTQRLTFDSSSPNGILLFRQVSKVWMKTMGPLLAGAVLCQSRMRSRWVNCKGLHPQQMQRSKVESHGLSVKQPLPDAVSRIHQRRPSSPSPLVVRCW